MGLDRKALTAWRGVCSQSFSQVRLYPSGQIFCHWPISTNLKLPSSATWPQVSNFSRQKFPMFKVVLAVGLLKQRLNVKVKNKGRVILANLQFDILSL